MLKLFGWSPCHRQAVTCVLLNGIKGRPLSNGSYSPPTIANPPSLPRLPLPTLEDTCKRYLKSVAPLLHPSELEVTKKNVQDLLVNSGPKLHAELEKLASGSGYPESFIEGFWDDMYLNGRWSLPINSNPALMWRPDPINATQLERSVSVTYSAIKFAYKVLSKKLEVPFVGSKPLDSFQYSRMFASTRIPKHGRDLWQPKPHAPGLLDTIVVQHAGRQYELNVLDRTTGQMISKKTLRDHFNWILEQGKQGNSSMAFGALTTLGRDEFADIRARLIERSNDEQTISTFCSIDSSLFIVSLDAPDNLKDPKPLLVREMESFLHGRPSYQPLDRWFDKSVSLVFSQAGNACVNFEHSWGDGVPVARFMEDIWNDTQGTKTQPGSEVYGTLKASLNLPRELKVNEDLVWPFVSSALTQYQQFAKSVDLGLNLYEAYGKNAIKNAKLSPDSFVQMAFQLAYYRLYSQLVSTYEACNMQHFHHGRTEAIRSVTAEVKQFVESFSVSSSSDRLQLLQHAIRSHALLAEAAREGKGVDRHLQGLMGVAKRDGIPLPTIFTDPAWNRYSANILSTSTLGLPFIHFASFGAVHEDGYGIAYVIHDNSIHVACTSYSSSKKNIGVDSFLKSLNHALDDMGSVVNIQPKK